MYRKIKEKLRTTYNRELSSRVDSGRSERHCCYKDSDKQNKKVKLLEFHSLSVHGGLLSGS